jgi:hypothetical protein
MHILAEKYDLMTEYSYWLIICILGIPLYSGSNNFPENRILDSDAKMEALLQEIESSSFVLQRNLIMQGDIYCQTKEMTNRIYDFLRSERIRSRIIQANPFQSRYQNNMDVFVHIRLGDVTDKNPGFAYYEKVLKSLEIKGYDRIFLSSDSPYHPICQQIFTRFRKTTCIQMDEIQIINYASTCKYVVLSHGSFSAIIGYFAFFSEVYYPAYDESERWYGDMFSVPGFQKVHHRSIYYTFLSKIYVVMREGFHIFTKRCNEFCHFLYSFVRR